MKNTSTRVLIVGAGPSGLTCAVELARHGIMADVIEKRSGPSGLSRAVGILPDAMDVFDHTSVGVAVRAEAVAIISARIHVEDRRLGEISMVQTGDERNRLLGLPQDRTEYHLRTEFESRGGEIRYGSKLIGLEQSDGRAEARIEKENNVQQQEYDYVVGADGVGSNVRQSIGIEFEGHDLDEQWSIADVDCEDWSATEQFSIYLRSRGRVVIVVPLEKQRYRVVSNTRDALDTLPVSLTVKQLRREAQFTISVKQAQRYVTGCVAIVGDAAHAHSPVGGRGMNLGVVDAAFLAQSIADNNLESYQHNRYAEGTRIVEFTERARTLITSNSVLGRAIVRVVVWCVSRSPMLNKMVARRLVSM